MYHPRTDVTHQYRYVPTDFVKHLAMTTVVILVLSTILSAVFREPVRPDLKIQAVAQSQPVLFEQVAMGDLDGQGAIANYGPPYNNGTGSVQSVMQRWVGILYPVNAQVDDVLKPLGMEAAIDPSIKGLLTRFQAASPAKRAQWEQNYVNALAKAKDVHGTVIVPAGSYGPVEGMMTALLRLGQSGMMAGALNRSPADYQFNSMYSLLFLQGAPLHAIAGNLQLKGEQWGIIHEEQISYPGPWWMTIVTAIYQIPAIANAPAADALALGGGMLLFLILVLAPWIPVINRLPRYLGLHRLIWRQYYQEHPDPGRPPASGQVSSGAAHP